MWNWMLIWFLYEMRTTTISGENLKFMSEQVDFVGIKASMRMSTNTWTFVRIDLVTTLWDFTCPSQRLPGDVVVCGEALLNNSVPPYVFLQRGSFPVILVWGWQRVLVVLQLGGQVKWKWSCVRWICGVGSSSGGSCREEVLQRVWTQEIFICRNTNLRTGGWSQPKCLMISATAPSAGEKILEICYINGEYPNKNLKDWHTFEFVLFWKARASKVGPDV